MKKIVIAVFCAITVVALLSGSANALQVTPPTSSQYNGWYKDSITFTITHTAGACQGHSFPYTYTPTSDTTEPHQFQFYYDAADDAYVNVDNSGMMMVPDPSCPSTSPGSPTQGPKFAFPIDSQSPFVNITDPNSSITTSATSYDISGFASDSGNGSGLKSVRALINGSQGPSASISGNTFSVTVPLASGNNTIQMVAYDGVGHAATSNSVTITSGTGSSGGAGSTGGTSGGGTGGSGNTGGSGSSNNGSASGSNSTSSTPAKSSDNQTNSQGQSGGSANQAVKFNQSQVLNIQDSTDESADPLAIQETAALAGATGLTYKALWTIIIILFLLCAVVVWRFRPIFAELDHDKSGLRRRIIIIVTLPSLVPLLGLGFLGYQQLSNSVKNSLSSQLEKAAQTSALKLDREFNIRESIITKSSSDILQIKTQYQAQRDKLNQQDASCGSLVKTAIPKRQYATVTSSDDCLPFLTGFAQLASASNATANSYLDALNQGNAQAQKDLTAQENQRVDELLGSIKHYFPDILELDIVDSSGQATIKASLPRTDNNPTIAMAHADLLKQAASANLALFDTSNAVRQLILTYPVKSGSQTLGGTVAAFDTDNKYFIPNIWSSTPKPYAADQVYFVTTAGELITPKSAPNQLNSQIKAIASTSSGKVYDLKLASQTLATRTSPVANTNWVVAVGAPSNSILAPLAGIQRTALLAIAGFLLLSALLGIYFVSGIAGEIERLFRGALAFAKGDLDYRIGLSSHDELQSLGDTMDKMAADIKAAQTALVEKDKEFINVATHELKAPMTSIIGNLSMITEDGMGQVDEAARKLILQAYNGTIRLRDIVTDMLDIARLESGHAEFKPEKLDIASITQGIVDMQTVPAQQSSVSLVYQPAGGLPGVLADKNKLTIILTNFISNAIKYNKPQGSVTITHTVDGGKLVTSIADTGLGIPEDQQARMFEKFFRVQHEDRSNVPGTGLGLHITKRFIEAMGGTVWFKSVHGQGTTFFFSLPLATASQAPVPPNSAAASNTS